MVIINRKPLLSWARYSGHSDPRFLLQASAELSHVYIVSAVEITTRSIRWSRGFISASTVPTSASVISCISAKRPSTLQALETRTKRQQAATYSTSPPTDSCALVFFSFLLALTRNVNPENVQSFLKQNLGR